MTGCGIDFGTSNSAIAVGATLAPVEGGSLTLPSAIFYPATGKPVFGRQAQNLFLEGEDGRFMRSLKRMLGTSLMGQGTVINGRMVRFEDIIGAFIRHLKSAAEAAAGQPLTRVVMGRPVHFVDGDDAADAKAQAQLEGIARAAGFTEVAFQFEPIAAAFFHETKVTGEQLALVADVGGGTSDFTVIRLSKDRALKRNRADDILGNAGIRVGGNDFDKSLSLHSFMPALGYRSTYGEKNLSVPLGPFHDMSEWSKVNFLYTPRLKQELRKILQESHARQEFSRFVTAVEKETGHRVLAAVEDAKIALTTAATAEADLDFIEAGLSVTADRPAFQTAVMPHIDAISASITECLARAHINEQTIDMIILTGGPTETPALKQAVCGRFPHALVSEGDKLSSVARGLGQDSLRVFGHIS